MRDDEYPPPPRIDPEERARLKRLIDAAKPRIKAIAARYHARKQGRRRKGSADQHEDLRDFINEGLKRVLDNNPRIQTEVELVEAFRKKLDNRDRAERRSTKTKVRQSDYEPSEADSAAEIENIVPWRPPLDRPDKALEVRGRTALLRAYVDQRVPKLLPLLDLYLTEDWEPADEAEALSLPITEIYAMRRRLSGLLTRYLREGRQGE